MKKFLAILITLGILCVAVCVYCEMNNQNFILKQQLKDTKGELAIADEELGRKKSVVTEVEIKKVLFEKTRQKAISFNEQIRSNVELIVLNAKGSYDLTHDRTPRDSCFDWLFGAEAFITLEFNTGIGIKTEHIYAYPGADGEITITYDFEQLQISYVEISNLGASQNYGLFGTSYSAEEISALTMIGKFDVESEIQQRIDLFELAEQNLVNEIRRIANQFTENKVTIKRAK